jgi:DNA-binding transcriptional MerR regulator
VSGRLRIGAFARATGLSKDTIRFYEREGLLTPTVEPNGYRSFGPEQVERAVGIRAAQALGFTLAEIGDTIVAWDAEGLTPAGRLALLERKRDELRARIERLEAMAGYLEAKAAWIRAGEPGVPPDVQAALFAGRKGPNCPVG